MTERIDDVTVVCKANVYFDGRVVSHTILHKDGKKKTVGLIYPGNYTFNTDAPEVMEIISGACRTRKAGEAAFSEYSAGTSFKVPGKSSFDISVDSDVAEYVCSFE